MVAVMEDPDKQVQVAIIASELKSLDGRMDALEKKLEALDLRLQHDSQDRTACHHKLETTLAKMEATQRLEFAKRDEFSRGAKWAIYIAWAVLTSGLLAAGAKLLQFFGKG